jgi:hypothetical protein
MAHVVMTYARTPLSTRNGRTYVAQACGRERDDATWEGWLEFVPDDGSDILYSDRETTQPNYVDLEYWATGLTPVYLEGAFARARSNEVVTVPTARTPVVGGVTPTVQAVLDPFSAYAQGEEVLRAKLGALSPLHLRAIVRDYELDGADGELEALTKPELVALIVTSVRRHEE